MNSLTITTSSGRQAEVQLRKLGNGTEITDLAVTISYPGSNTFKVVGRITDKEVEEFLKETSNEQV